MLKLVRNASMIAGFVLAGVELVGLAFEPPMSAIFWVIYLAAVLVVIFGALFVRTEGFRNQSPDIKTNAHAIGAGIMIFGFLGVTAATGGIDRSSFIPLIVLAVAVAFGFAADAVVQGQQQEA